ncbi:MAG: hypothetical protein EXR86_05535 [Gammaproteobacteria bacterium]|nr:hypothetical protein [Gammaproteobacteria bacterium]
MPRNDFCVAEVASWRALFGCAQHACATYLPAAVEDYAIRLLYRNLGQPSESLSCAANYAERVLAQCQRAPDLATVGDQSLIFAGLFPEHAIGEGIPIAYFVHIGMNAYREFAAAAPEQESRDTYIALANTFVMLVDVLHTLREVEQDEPVIDGLNAYQLWHETGSLHAWQVLRRLTPSLPATHITRACH